MIWGFFPDLAGSAGGILHKGQRIAIVRLRKWVYEQQHAFIPSLIPCHYVQPLWLFYGPGLCKELDMLDEVERATPHPDPW